MKARVFALLGLSIMLLASCKNQPEVPDGGPCSYQHTYYPAVITDILIVNDNYRDIVLTVYSNETTDTLYYSSELSGYISKVKLDSLGYKAGDTMTYEYMQIIEGHCTPDIYVLRNERFGSLR